MNIVGTHVQTSTVGWAGFGMRNLAFFLRSDIRDLS